MEALNLILYDAKSELPILCVYTFLDNVAARHLLSVFWLSFANVEGVSRDLRHLVYHPRMVHEPTGLHFRPLAMQTERVRVGTRANNVDKV